MKKVSFLISALIVSLAQVTIAQQPFYDVTAGNGNGIRLWQDDTYKIHMGKAPEYQYGPVFDYSIKTNMSANSPGRGWTWGVAGATPVAAINTYGQMQIAGQFFITGSNEVEFGRGVSKEGNAGKIAYQQFSDALDIVGAGTTSTNRKIKFWNEGGATFTGVVGMGSLTPIAPLHVKGSGNLGHLIIETNNGGEGDLRWHQGGATAGTERAAFQLNATNGNFQGHVFNSANWVQWLEVDRTNGNVGIGTTDPKGYKLAVAGKAVAEEVNVKLQANWPDYVFEKEYALPSLESVQSYIHQNKHLPEVPSAKEMEANGINLSEMNMLLLKKVEELTLYVIEQEKRIKVLETKVNDN